MFMDWTPEEQAQHRARWVNRLRNGGLNQATGALVGFAHNPDGTPGSGYCCLGVACVVASEDPDLAEHLAVDYRSWEVVFNDGGYDEYLPDVLVRYYGLNDDHGSMAVRNYDGLEDTSSLVEWNDNGLSFSAIADIIEAGFDEAHNPVPVPAKVIDAGYERVE